ncbi:MAG: DUF2905 domain-containing protein [Betaproteobacteria bacterium]|jgi:Protein of unknown function (DUF2905)|nr:DUF2905 domain-containing protein [Betaproteobacteria bacterium]NDB01165.1 DUF2905 domain-containing protein [Betaproteobacteria bacterium]
MFRWLLVIFLALMVINALTPWVRKLGVGKLPGDLRFKLFGREFFLPFTSTVLLSLVAAALARFI